MNALLQVKIITKATLAEGIAGYELAPLSDDPLPAFEAGSNIDVHISGGLVRQYSLYDLPAEHVRYRIGVLCDPESRGASAKLVDDVQEGHVLEISAPRNYFPLHSGPANSVLFAGGIGITPIPCMAQQLAREGQPFYMHYCGCTRSRMAFVDRLKTERFQDRVRVYADDEALDQQLDAWPAIGAPAADKHLYVCGPSGFIDYILVAARELGWHKDHLHREYFAVGPIAHSSDGPLPSSRSMTSAAASSTSGGSPRSASVKTRCAASNSILSASMIRRCANTA